MGVRSDVEKNHFVGALFIIAHRQFHVGRPRSATSLTGLAELNFARDLAASSPTSRHGIMRRFAITTSLKNAARPKAKENDAMPSISGPLPPAKQNLSTYPFADVPVLNQLQKQRNAMHGIRTANNPNL